MTIRKGLRAVQSWMSLQTAYEIKVAQKNLARQIAREVVPMAV